MREDIDEGNIEQDMRKSQGKSIDGQGKYFDYRSQHIIDDPKQSSQANIQT